MSSNLQVLPTERSGATQGPLHHEDLERGQITSFTQMGERNKHTKGGRQDNEKTKEKEGKRATRRRLRLLCDKDPDPSHLE